MCEISIMQMYSDLNSNENVHNILTVFLVCNKNDYYNKERLAVLINMLK